MKIQIKNGVPYVNGEVVGWADIVVSLAGVPVTGITGVEYVKDYTMRLEFSNGKVKLIDFLPLLKGKLFEPLKDLRNFVQFGLTHWTLEWYNGADFAPDYLYRNGVEA